MGVWDNSISYSDRTAFPFYYILAPFYQNGAIAVKVFWAISGFIFFWKYSDSIYKRSVSSARFFVLRFSRLYPLHFMTLITVAILQFFYVSSHNMPFIYDHNDSQNFVLQLGLASNWLNRQPYTFNGPIWSISAEVLAYLFFFIVARFIKPGLSISIAIVASTRIAIAYHPQIVLICIHFFFSGGLTQQIIARLSRRGRAIAFWGASGAIVFIIATLYRGHPVTLTYILILSTSIVSWFTLIESANELDMSKWSWLGDLTYSSYLLHFPIQLAVVLIIDALGVDRHIFLSPFTLSLFLFMTFGAAWITHHHFEMPMQNAIRAVWLSRRPQKVLP
jgi:peptidoglycan/LPS O-acetylase OafA/YrhL